MKGDKSKYSGGQWVSHAQPVKFPCQNLDEIYMQPIEGIEYFYLDKIKVLETRQSHSPCTCIQQGLNISTLDNIFVIFKLIFPDGIFLSVRTLGHSLGGL